MSYGSHPNDNYDYTDIANNGGGGGDDDFVLGNVSAAGFDADKMEQENGYREIPAGEHLLVIQDVKVDKEAKFHQVLVDGRPASYTSYSAIVRFAMPNDKRATISDFFTLPPATPHEQDAYRRGIPTPKPGEAVKPDAQPGWAANKFFHFMDRMGFIDPKTKALTAQGGRISGWKGRTIFVTVSAGKGTYINKRGEAMPRGNQIKLFSYRAANGQHAGQAGGHGGQPPFAPNRSPQPQQPQYAQRPAPAQASASVDDVLANI